MDCRILLVLAIVSVILTSGCITGQQISDAPEEAVEEKIEKDLGGLLIGGNDLEQDFVYGDPMILGVRGQALEVLYRNATKMKTENGIMLNEIVENTVYRFGEIEDARVFFSDFREGKEGEISFDTNLPSDSFGWFSTDTGFTELMFRNSNVIVRLKYWETIDIYHLPVPETEITKVAEKINRKF
ncbi:MAG: hypothetical protein JW754_06140 [Candidatus Aenigmarchaeota archaeon]|nr:hypothetical protein [Candidatus Aenigmarchaeota archaeon]